VTHVCEHGVEPSCFLKAGNFLINLMTIIFKCTFYILNVEDTVKFEFYFLVFYSSEIIVP